MEEIYIVKLKGLPPPTGTSQESLSKDNKTSFYYHTDLTAEAIRGFSYLHIFFGCTVLCLSVTNLCFHENPLALDPPLGITVWCAAAFIFLGIFGIVTAYKRKSNLSRSIFYVKVHLIVIVVVLSMTFTFIILFALDLHGPIANQFIGLNIFFSIMVETVILLLTLFTCARVLWPGCANFWAKDWPMQPKLKRKVIVKTKVFADGIKQEDSNTVQSVGPNCVISLNMPPLSRESGTCSPSPISSLASSPKSTLHFGDNFELTHSPTMHSAAEHPISGDECSYCSSPQLPPSNSQSIVRSPLSATPSFPLTPASSSLTLKTFPNDQRIRDHCHSTVLYGHPNRLLYQRSHMFNRRTYLGSNSVSCKQDINGKQLESEEHSGSEEIDPYDTDEFDCCTTEDEDEMTTRRVNSNDTYICFDDEGNSTLDSDNKLSAISDQSSCSNSENELNLATNECHHSESCNDTSNSLTNHKERSLVLSVEKAINHVSDDNKIVSTNWNESDPPDDHKASNLHLDDNCSQQDNETDDRDEGIASSGSSTCSGELALPLTKHFENQLHFQCFKSSIRIESNPDTTSCTRPVALEFSFDETVPTDTVVSKSTTNKSSLVGATSKPKAPTIRMLTTKSVSNNQKVRVELNRPNNHTTIPQIVSDATHNKLASHPYLRRLRTNNVGYPKYVSTPATATSCSTSEKLETISSTSLSDNSHRVPDIQRV